MKQILRLSVVTMLLALPLVAGAQSAAITRADFIVNMMASKGLYGNGGYCFPDVTNQAFALAVCEAKARGYVTGYGDGRFHPYQSVTLVDAAVFAMRLERVALPGDTMWYRPAIEKLAAWDAIPESIRSIADPLSVSQANEVLISVRNRGDDNDDRDEQDDVRHDDDHDDLTVSITDDPVRADEGDIIEYRIRVQNDENDDVDVDIRAELDGDMSFVSATGGGDHEQDRVDWDDVNINDNDDVVYTLLVRVRDNAGDTVKLRVRANDELDEEETDIQGNGSRQRSSGGNGDVSVTIDDSDDRIEPGDTVTYRIRLKNDGNDDERVDVRAELDDHMNFVSASNDGDRSGDRVDWNDIRVNEDETETLLLTVRADSSLDDGDTIRLRVVTDDDSETEDTEIDDNGRKQGNDDDANVTVSITEANDPVEEGEVITYRIRITNNENQIISIDPTAFLDEETSFVSASDGGDLRGGDEVEWENISIARDDTKTLLLSVRPRSAVRDGDSVRIRVEAGDDEDTEDTRIEDNNDHSNNSNNDDIRVSIMDSVDPAQPGDTVTYRIRVENRDNDDTSVDVRAHLDGDMTYVSSSENGDLSGSEVRWDNVDVDGDDDVTLILNVRIRSSADDGDTVRLDVDVEGVDETETTRIED